MKYNNESLSKICDEISIGLSDFLEKTKDKVIYTSMSLYSEEGYNVGRVIKEHDNCEFKLGSLIHSENGSCDGNIYRYNSSEPSKVKRYIKPKNNNENSGRLSEEGYKYFYESLCKLIENDPPQMMQALNFVRSLIRKTSMELAIKISAKHYEVDTKLLESRNGSRVCFWKYAKRK